MIHLHKNALFAWREVCRYAAGQWRGHFDWMIAIMAVLMVSAAPSALYGGEPEDALTARVKAYWEAKSESDFRAAYEMESVRFRKELPLEKYEKINHNPMLRISKVEVRNVVVEGDKGKADVAFTLDIDQAGARVSLATPPRIEAWEKVDGVWYKKYFPPQMIINQNNIPVGPR